MSQIHICHSCHWLSLTETYCSHCLRIVVEGLTVEAVFSKRRVNLRAERRKLFRLYRGTPVLSQRRYNERRVLRSLGLQ